jgi:hypothetical protein
MADEVVGESEQNTGQYKNSSVAVVRDIEQTVTVSAEIEQRQRMTVSSEIEQRQRVTGQRLNRDKE